jgi:hypothetical protein
MPTDKHRIAAYLPKEVDEKFQVFKKEREVGDSQALILILSEFLGVSQQVTYSIDSPLVKQFEELSSLLSELKIELSTKVGENQISELKSELLCELSTKIGEDRISELKGELLSELKAGSSSGKSKSNSPKQVGGGGEILGTQQKVKKPKDGKKSTEPNDEADGINILTTAQLAQRLGIEKSNTITTAKFTANKKKDLSYFTNWSKERDSEGYSWEFKSDSKLFYKVAHQSNR